MNHFRTKPGYSRFATLLKVFSFLLLLVSAKGIAQGTITGTITNSDGEELAQTEVINRTTDSRVTTGNDGSFTLPVTQGDNQVVFYKDGYLFQEQTVSSSQNTVAVVLQKVIELNEVVIQKEKDKFFALSHLKDIEETAIYAGKKTEVIVLDNITANKAVNNARQIFAQVVGLTINEYSNGGLQLSIGGRGLDHRADSPARTRSGQLVSHR